MSRCADRPQRRNGTATYSAIPPIALLIALISADASAANVHMTADDNVTPVRISFNTAGKWDSGVAPVGTNDYFANGFLILTPGTNNLTFGGKSLQLRVDPSVSPAGSNSILAFNRGGATNITVADLQAYSGSSIVQFTGTSASPATTTLMGNVHLSGTVSFDVRSAGRNIELVAPITDTIDTTDAVGSVVIASSVSTSTATSGGAVVYSSNANTYSGNTTVNNWAMLRMNAENAMPHATTDGDLIVNSGGTFRLNGKNTTIQGLAGGGTVENANATGATLTVQGDLGAVNNSFSGEIRDGTPATGVLSLTKTVNTTQILAGVNSYTGKTTVSGGTLEIRNNNALGAVTGGTLVDGTGTLALSNGITTGENITLTGRTSSSTTPTQLSNASGANSVTGVVSLLSGGGGADYFNIDSAAGSSLSLVTVKSITTNPDPLNLSGAGGGSITSLDLGSAGVLTKSGSGTWSTGSMTGVETVNVAGGTLAVGSGMVTGTGGVTALSVASGAIIDASGVAGNFRLRSGATLSGAGKVQGGTTGTEAESGSTIVVGDLVDAAILSVTGPLTLDSGSLLSINIIDPPTGVRTVDLLDVSGELTAIAGASLRFIYSPGSLNDAAYIFASYGSWGAGGAFSLLAPVSGYSVVYGYLGANVALVKNKVPVPAPLFLLGLGALVLAGSRRLPQR